MSGITLPHQNLVCQWMALHGVHAVGIGLVAGGEVMAINVYGELSKGIVAPQNTVWSSKALADALSVFTHKQVEEAGDVATVDIFAGLDMPDTELGDAIAVLNRLARPHNNRDGIYVFKPYDTKQHLFTTVGDFCKLLIHINQLPNVGALLGTSTEPGALVGGWKYWAGMPGSEDGFINYTAGNGASHFILLLPQSRQGLVIFTNSDNGGRVVDCILKFVGIEVG